MYVHVPAMRGKIGNRTYYSCLMPMSAIPNMFKFTDWIGFTPEDREQRVLDEKRVPDIKKYILDNEDDYLFSAITASYKSQPVFEPAVANGDTRRQPGHPEASSSATSLIINDGQHRCAGIAAALKENPNIGDHTISVILFPYESLERVQQMFSDLNRFVVKTSKSLDILYDKRDKMSAATLDPDRQRAGVQGPDREGRRVASLEVDEALHAGRLVRRQPRAAYAAVRRTMWSKTPPSSRRIGRRSRTTCRTGVRS